MRQRWPQSLVGWNRVLRGQFTDPTVGRDVLMGIAAGVVAQLVGSAGLLFGTPRQIVLLADPVLNIGSGPFDLRVIMGPLSALGASLRRTVPGASRRFFSVSIVLFCPPRPSAKYLVGRNGVSIVLLVPIHRQRRLPWRRNGHDLGGDGLGPVLPLRRPDRRSRLVRMATLVMAGELRLYGRSS